MKKIKEPPPGLAEDVLRRQGISSLNYIGVHAPPGKALYSAFTGSYQGQNRFWYVRRQPGSESCVIHPGPLISRENPKKVDVYDPRDEQVRAQRQGIYESEVKKSLGLPSSTPFRDMFGTRLDTRAPLEKMGKIFAMSTAVAQRDARFKPGTAEATTYSSAESQRRYSDPDSLLRNRQDYEETLGIHRKSGFYRAVLEPTRRGNRWFVWPLPPGVQTPVPKTQVEAENEVSRLNRTADPRSTGKWWIPRHARYTARELENWLPDTSVFH